MLPLSEIMDKYQGHYNFKKEPVKPKEDPEALLQRFVNAGSALHSGFTINESNMGAIWNLCLYFSGSPEFERGGLRLEKGLMIMGNVGSGKTTLMRLFSQVVPFHMMYVGNICDNVRKDGQEELDKIKARAFDEICFDDFGSESKIKHYGSNYDVMYDIVVRRCYHYVHHRTKTHFTTNMTLDEIRDIYDARIESRINELCNIIVIGGNKEYIDWRKK